MTPQRTYRVSKRQPRSSATVSHCKLWRYIKSKGSKTGHLCSFYCGVLGSNIGPEMCFVDIYFWYSSLFV